MILIATGSSPFRPPEIPFEEPDVHDSDDILELDRLPASLAVLGGGVIGCEYASMFAALGTDVIWSSAVNRSCRSSTPRSWTG